MICDDEDELLNLYALLIRRKYNVLTTASGDECIRKFCEEQGKGLHIDLLFLDYKLKDMLGDEVAKVIRKLYGTKIILISAFDLEEEMVKELKENGIKHTFLPKTFNISNMLQEVERIIC